jgi:hypothetical protein
MPMQWDTHHFSRFKKDREFQLIQLGTKFLHKYLDSNNYENNLTNKKMSKYMRTQISI